MIRALTTDLQWKALALLVAVVLWFAVVGEPELVTAHAAPVFFKNLPHDLEIESDVPDRVRLELRGPAGRLAPSALADTAVVMDLSNVHGAGENTFNVTAAGLTLPTGVTLLRAVPAQLHLNFEKVMAKMVPVQVRIGTPLPSGYHITKQSLTPPRLRIVGPESHVQPVENALTDAIDMASVVGRAEFRVHAYMTDPRVRFEDPPMVTVRIDVEKK